MRKTPVCLLLAAVLLLVAAPAWAQRAGRVSIAADVGMIWPRFDHPDVDRFRTKPDLVYGGHFAYGATDHVGLQFGLTRTQQDVDTGARELNTMVIQEIYALFNWNLQFGPVQPYASLGVGYYLITLDPPLPDENDAGLIFGAGADLLFTDNISAGLTARYSYIFARDFDFARNIVGLATVAFAF